MTTVDGVTRKRVAALDKHTGRLIPTFDVGLNGPNNNLFIEAMEVANDRVYLIGEFDPLTPQQPESRRSHGQRPLRLARRRG